MKIQYLWSPNDEVATWVNVNHGLLIQIVVGNDFLDNFILDLFSQGLQCNL